MNLGFVLASAVLAAATTSTPGTESPSNLVTHEISASAPAATVAEAAPRGPRVGEPAPDFAYKSRTYVWQNLHNMLEDGPVLLVFGASDEQLVSIEREAERFERAGIQPVAVVPHRDADAWKLLRRYDLSFSLLSDPNGVIASQYATIEAGPEGSVPSWFVVDRACRIRGAGTGTPASGDWMELASETLATDSFDGGSTN